MKTSTLAAMLILAVSTSACALNGEYTQDQAQADALERCSFYEDQKKRTFCMKQMMADAETERRAEVADQAADQKDHEDEMARREAMGLPTN